MTRIWIEVRWWFARHFGSEPAYVDQRFKLQLVRYTCQGCGYKTWIGKRLVEHMQKSYDALLEKAKSNGQQAVQWGLPMDEAEG